MSRCNYLQISAEFSSVRIAHGVIVGGEGGKGGEQVSYGGIIKWGSVWEAIALGGDCPGGNFPGGNCPVPIFKMSFAVSFSYAGCVLLASNLFY